MGFHKKNIIVNKGTSREKVLSASFLLEQTHVSKSEGQITWYQEPYLVDGEIQGTFRHTNCLRASYDGVFRDNVCKFCRSMEFIPTFRQKILNHKEEAEEPHEKKIQLSSSRQAYREITLI